MQRLGGRLREVVPYETRTAKAKFFSRPRMEWNIYAEKNNESVVLLTKSLAILCDSLFTEVHLFR